MFRSRKRKVSPDKKTDKTKKLKVSSKIFRSPTTTKVTTSAKSKLNKLLPEGYEYIILTANTKPVESFPENEAVIGSVRLPIATKEDAMVWVKKFERKTFTSYRTQKTWKKDTNTGLLKRKYICNFRTREKSELLVPPSCKGNITLIIKDQDDAQTNPEDYPSQAIIHFYHSHKIDPDSYMKNLRPSAELRIIFGTYFAKGHSPFSALICHKSDLHSSYGAEFYNVVSNGAICPSYNWCFNEYEKFFMRKFLEPSEEKLKEKLLDNLTQFNGKWRSECALISDDPVFVLSICTPLMKSVFRSGFAESFVSVRCFSTPKSVPKKQKLILFLCHTPIGSLPFGVVVTCAEDTETVCKGIRVLVHMLGHTTYQPKTIITDENALVSKALKRCFPESQILFNEFQMLQSIWRIIRIVCADDDEEFQALYNLFLVTLNSNSEEEFNRNFDSLLVYAEKYPRLTNFLKYFKVRADAYVFYARPKFEFDTDLLNYTDSGTTILQDVLIKYGNFFNILQLFDFLSKTYVDHYERKLTRIVEGDLKGFFKTNFYVPLSKIADFTCEKISDTEFIVSLNEMKFFVNAQLDTCTCQVGVYGGSCVHQYIVEKRLGLTPECYTPLCDEILNILKQILTEKNTRPPILESDHKTEFRSALGSFKSGLDTIDSEPDTLSDIVPSVGCSELSNFSGMPQDMDNLGPLDEVFSTPPDITDTLTDITEEAMSPLVLSEFEDAHDEYEDFLDDSEPYNRESGEIEPKEQSDDILEYSENLPTEIIPRNLDQSDEDFLDDSELYNRESGELEPKEQSDDILEADSFSDNFPTEVISKSLDQSVPSTSTVEMCEYDEGIISGEDELEMEQGVPIEKKSVENLPVDDSVVLSTDIQGSVVYAYPIQNQEEIEYFETTMTENERKTAEIAEFLTNLPDTNNLSSGTLSQGVDVVQLVDKNTSDDYNEVINTTDYIEETVVPIVEQDQVISNGVVVLSNEEYFSNYNILDNNVLAVVPDNDNAMFSKNENNISDTVSFDVTTSNDAQNIITDSYEENNLVMMSPNDLFDDNRSPETIGKHEGKINVLSSVIIKPPTLHLFSLNLNSIKNKTQKNVKEENFQRNKQSDTMQNIQDQPELETQIIPEKESDVSENDVIKLYCNQSGDKISLEEKDLEEILKMEQSNKIISSENEFEPDTNAVRVLETKIKIQKPKTEQVASKLKGISSAVKKVEQTALSSETDSCSDKNVKDCRELSFADCDLEELAQHDFMEIEEIDSDDLEDLASQEYDPDVVSPIPDKTPIFGQPLPSEKNLKLIPMKNVPSGLLSFHQKSTTPRSGAMSLKDFMSKSKASQKFKEPSDKKQLNLPQSAIALKENASQKIKEPSPKKQTSMPHSASGLKENASQKIKEPSAEKQTNMPQSAGGLKENVSLEKRHSTISSKLENLLGKDRFKNSVAKFLGKHSADDTSSQEKDDTAEMINKIKRLGNSITLAPVQTSRSVKKSPVKKATNLNINPKPNNDNTKKSPFNLKGSQTKQNSGDNRTETATVKAGSENTFNKNIKIINNKLTNFKQNVINIKQRKSVSAFRTFDQSDSKPSVSDLDEECESNASYSILDELSEEELIALGIISEDYSSDDSIDRPDIYSPPPKSFSQTHLESDLPIKSQNSRFQPQRPSLDNKNKNKTVDSNLQPKKSIKSGQRNLRRRTTTPKYNYSSSSDDEFDGLITKVTDLVDKTKRNVKPRSPVKKKDTRSFQITKDQSIQPENLQRWSEVQEDFNNSDEFPKTLESPKSTERTDSVSQKLSIPALKRVASPSTQFQQSNLQSSSENKMPGSNLILTTSDQTTSFNAKTNVKQAYLINFPNDVTVRKVCDKNQSAKQVSSPSIIIDKWRFESPKSNSHVKDIEDLEAVLTSTVDTGYGIDSNAAFRDTKRIQATSVFQNQDLSFLFEDPRFETIVEEENANASKLENILLKSHVKSSRNEVSPKKPMSSANAFLFDDPQFETIVAEDNANTFKVQTVSLKSHVKSSKNEGSPKKIKSSADSRVKKSVCENATSSPSIQNNIITLMVFKDGSFKPIEENLSTSKPDVSLNKKKTYNLVHTEIYKSTNKSGGNDNVKKPNRNNYEKHVSLETPKKTKEKTSTQEVLINKVENSELSKNKRLELKRSSYSVNKKKMEHIDESEVGTFGDKKMSISSNKKKNNYVKSTENSGKVGLKNNTKEKVEVSKTQLATRSHRSLRKNQNNTEKEGITRDKSNSKKDNVKTSFSEINIRQTRNRSFDKQENTKKTIEHSKKSVSSTAENQHNSNKESQVIIGSVRNRKFTHSRWSSQKRSSFGKWISASPDRKIKENKNTRVNKNQTESKKGNNEQRFTSSSENRKVESESELDNNDSNLDLDTEDDFEDSIVASILKKQTSPTKENKLDKQTKGPFASTPKKSIGYEDAFKMFLESSNQWSFSKELDRSVSDYEKDIDDSDWESNRGSRRRTKSVSSPKEQPTSSKNTTPAKIKKSVSWADGLNRIDYIVESGSSSDDSEIVTRRPKSLQGRRTDHVAPKSSKPSIRTESTKSKFPNTSSRGRSTSLRSTKTDGRKPSSLPTAKERHRSATESPVSKKSRRSRSVTPKRETVKPYRRSQSCSRAKQVKSQLVVLIKRDRKIDAMCMLLNSTKSTLRSRQGGRIGLKELLQRARSVKYI